MQLQLFNETDTRLQVAIISKIATATALQPLMKRPPLKAFDMVDYSILLLKLEASGLGHDILCWFRSYLSDSQQLVDVSGTFSNPCSITCGVPQGPILG